MAKNPEYIYVSLSYPKVSRMDHMINFLCDEGFYDVKDNRSYRLNVIRGILNKAMNNMDMLNDPLHDNLSKN